VGNMPEPAASRKEEGQAGKPAVPVPRRGFADFWNLFETVPRSKVSRLNTRISGNPPEFF